MAFGYATFEIMTQRKRRQRRRETLLGETVHESDEAAQSTEEAAIQAEVYAALTEALGQLSPDDVAHLGLFAPAPVGPATPVMRKRRQRALDRLRRFGETSMVNLETLTARSLRHYELGRLRMASRVAIMLAPIVAVCLLEPMGREACACCAALLLASSGCGFAFATARASRASARDSSPGVFHWPLCWCYTDRPWMR